MLSGMRAQIDHRLQPIWSVDVAPIHGQLHRRQHWIAGRSSPRYRDHTQ